MAESQDVSLALRIARGDSEAENDFFLCFGEQIKMMVQARLPRKVPPEDREDLVSELQEAVLLSLRKGRFDPSREKPLGAYIAGIAGNIVGQYFRRKRKEKMGETGLRFEDSPAAGNIFADLIDAEREAALRKSLSRLKPRYKEVLLLRIYEQQSIEEIAEKLGLERRRVSERIHYAIQLLLKECTKANFLQY